MDQLAIHRIAEAAQVDALLVDQRSEHSFVFADTARVSDRDDLLPGLIGMLFAAGEKHLFVERWDAVNHIVQPEWTKLNKWDEAKLSVETLLDMTTGMDSDLALAGTIGHSHTFEPVVLKKLIEILETQTAQPIDEILACWLRDPLGIEPEHCRSFGMTNKPVAPVCVDGCHSSIGYRHAGRSAIRWQLSHGNARACSIFIASLSPAVVEQLSSIARGREDYTAQ